MFFFYCYVDHRDLHVRTHSFPTGRSSDLVRRTCPDDPAEVHAVLLPGSRGAIDPALVHRRPGRLQPPGRRHGWVDPFAGIQGAYAPRPDGLPSVGGDAPDDVGGTA